MKRLVTLLALSLLALGDSFAQGIEFFEGSWEDALQTAQEEGKIIFMDAYAVWCGPCKRMAKTTFVDESVGSFFNDKFLNVKMDMEKGDGPQLARKYGVRAYPTLLFIDYSGEVVHQARGAQGVSALLKLGETALSKIDRSGMYEEAYQNGDRSPQLVLNYIQSLNEAGKPSLKVSNEYLRSQKDLKSPENLSILYEATVAADSRIFNLFIDHRSELEALMGKEKVENRIESACLQTVLKGFEYDSPDLIEEGKTKMKANHSKRYAGFAAKVDRKYAIEKMDSKAYLKACTSYVKAVAKEEPKELHSLAREIIQHFPKDEKCMKYAEKLASDAAEQGELYNYYYTLAGILLANGKEKEALEVAEYSLELAKEIGPGAQQMVKQLIQTIEG